jgi:hypothetical protein
VALAGPGRTDEQRVLVRVDPLERKQLQRRAFGELGIVAPVKVVESLRPDEAREQELPLDPLGSPAVELVLDERGEALQE